MLRQHIYVLHWEISPRINCLLPVLKIFWCLAIWYLALIWLFGRLLFSHESEHIDMYWGRGPWLVDENLVKGCRFWALRFKIALPFGFFVFVGFVFIFVLFYSTDTGNLFFSLIYILAMCVSQLERVAGSLTQKKACSLSAWEIPCQML